MPLTPGSSQETISHNIDELTHHGSRKRPHAQIVAIALHNADVTKHTPRPGTHSHRSDHPDGTHVGRS
jgi:hypothetical protein